jgi:hypothetical protein
MIIPACRNSDTSAGKQPSVDFLGPLKIIFSIEVTFVILLLAIYYTVWQMTVAVMSTLFSATYGMSEIQIGLNTLPTESPVLLALL